MSKLEPIHLDILRLSAERELGRNVFAPVRDLVRVPVHEAVWYDIDVARWSVSQFTRGEFLP